MLIFIHDGGYAMIDMEKVSIRLILSDARKYVFTFRFPFGAISEHFALRDICTWNTVYVRVFIAGGAI